MRRTLALSVVFGSFLAGVGCFKHIAGKCDCTYNPADDVLPGPSNPYYPGQSFSGPVGPAAPKANSTEPAPPAVETAPPKKLDTPPVGDVPSGKISIPVTDAPAAGGEVALPVIPMVPGVN